MNKIELSGPLTTENDCQAALGLLSGLVSLKNSSPVRMPLMETLCTQLEVQLKPLFSEAEWIELEKQFGIYTKKAKAFADANKSDFEELEF